MKSFVLLSALIVIFMFSCNKEDEMKLNQEELNSTMLRLKQKDVKEINEGAKFKKIDSLSKYKISAVSKFIDSLKVSDSVAYFALRRFIENDTLNYYDDYDLISFWNVTKLKSDSEYEELATKLLLENKK